MKATLLIFGLAVLGVVIGCDGQELGARSMQRAVAKVPTTVPESRGVDRGSATISPVLTVEVGDARPIEFMSIPGAEFLMSRFEITQEQWASIMGRNPSMYQGNSLPVHNVSWFEATEFCRKVTALSGRKVQLPLASEWDHACRMGGKRGRNGGSQIRSAGSSLPDENGIYDMHGNVEEWCLDHLIIPMENDFAAELEQRLVRGASWIMPNKADGCVALFSYSPSARGAWLGFRVVTGGDEKARQKAINSFAPRVIRRRAGADDVDTGVRMQPMDSEIPTGEITGNSWWMTADEPPAPCEQSPE